MLLALSPIASYRRLLQLSGPSFVVAAFLGRIPLAMSQMGILLLVSDTTGRYGYGGLAAGAFAIANAIGAPMAGAIADRIGQRPVVLVQSAVSGLGLVALVTTTTAQAPLSAIVGLAVLAGLACPQVGPLARVRWRPITRPAGHDQPRLVDAAFSYEGAADEASFVLGPTLVGLVGVLISPAGAIVVAAVMLVVFGGWFGLHPTAELTKSARGAPVGGPARLLSVNFAVLLVAQLLIGTLFGATQTGTTVLATAAGQSSLAGLVHAVLGVGSVVAGLGTAALPPSFSHERRLLVAATALFALSLPLLWVDGLGGLIVVILILGFAVAPYVITTFTIAERVVPPARVAAAMTLLAAATGIGYALGSGVAGRLADWGGHTPAFAVTVSAMGVAAALAFTARSRLRHALDTAQAGRAFG